MARKRKPKAAGHDATPTVSVWYHPQLGVRIRTEAPAYSWRVDGLPLASWREVAKLDVVSHDRYGFTIVGGQALPRGYLWADPSKQKYGLSGPFLAYAPVERRCRDCGEMYTWSARAQQHLYETIRVISEKTARRCQSCARARRALETARAAYAEAARELDHAPTASAYVRVAKLMLELHQRGGRVSLERAIGYCTRARKLGGGAAVDAVEEKLRARRAAAP